MEDVIEQLLGREIFEKDDVAVDMRELARSWATKAPASSPAAASARTAAAQPTA